MYFPDIRDNYGVKRDTFYYWVEQGWIQPVAGPKVDGTGRYLFRRKDVEMDTARQGISVG